MSSQILCDLPKNTGMCTSHGLKQVHLVSRVHKVPQWETENLRHLHGQKVIAGGSRASVRQLDALLDLPTPYIDIYLFPGLPVFGLWFSIIYGSRITGSEATCSSGGSPTWSGFSPPHIRYTRNLISSRLPTTHAQMARFSFSHA